MRRAVSTARLGSNFLWLSIQPWMSPLWEGGGHVRPPLPRGLQSLATADDDPKIQVREQNKLHFSPGTLASPAHRSDIPSSYLRCSKPAGWTPKIISFNRFYLEQVFVFKLHTSLKIKDCNFLKVLGLLHSINISLITKFANATRSVEQSRSRRST